MTIFLTLFRKSLFFQALFRKPLFFPVPRSYVFQPFSGNHYCFPVLRPGSRTAAGPAHPKPAGPCSCGATQLRGRANPKWHTLVHSPGSRTAAGPAHPKPAGPSSCGAAQGTGKNISAKGTGKNKPKERLAYFFSRLCIFVPAWLGGLPPVPTRSARNSIDSKTA